MAKQYRRRESRKSSGKLWRRGSRARNSKSNATGRRVEDRGGNRK